MKMKSQSQGGGLPFWHTTVVVEPGGTTTVVFCGGGGLELLMQPANSAEAASTHKKTFISTPVVSDRMSRAGSVEARCAGGQEQIAQANVLASPTV